MPDLNSRTKLENDLERVLTRAFSMARRTLQDTLYKDGLTNRDLANLPQTTIETIKNELTRKVLSTEYRVPSPIAALIMD